jgi:hypothetical protein
MMEFDRSFLKTKDRMAFFDIPGFTRLPWIRHAFLTRQGGVSPAPFHSLNLSVATGDSIENTDRNREEVARTFGFAPERLVLLHQNHGNRVLVLRGGTGLPSSPLEYDAMITDEADRFLAIKTADCLPILIVDQVRKVVAAIHAGREGTALRITPKVLQTMVVEFGCSREDLLIAMGPSIGVCCYEVDESVFRPELKPLSIPGGNGKWRIDLPGINRRQIMEEGINEHQIFRIDLCTACNTDLFFSHRRERRTGRQISFIGRTSKETSRAETPFHPHSHTTGKGAEP